MGRVMNKKLLESLDSLDNFLLREEVEYHLEVWETDEDRDQGFSYELDDRYIDKNKAIKDASRELRRLSAACIEVRDDQGRTIYTIDNEGGRLNEGSNIDKELYYHLNSVAASVSQALKELRANNELYLQSDPSVRFHYENTLEDLKKTLDSVKNFQKMLEPGLKEAEESSLWGLWVSNGSGMLSYVKFDGKFIAFTSKEEAAKCKKNFDDRNGYINNFTRYGVTKFDPEDHDRCQIFNTYEEYKDFADKWLADENTKKEAKDKRNAEARDEIMYKLAEDLKSAGFNVVSVGDDIAPHRDIDDVTLRTSIYCHIIADVGIGSDPRPDRKDYGYGDIKLDVREDGLIRSSDCGFSVEYLPYDECKDYIIKAIDRLKKQSGYAVKQRREERRS